MSLRRVRRSAALLAASSLSVSLLCSDFARADGAVAPPARVGRLAASGGSVSFHTAGTDGWQDAVVNTPVTTGDAVFAQTGGHAELEVANSIVALDSASELDIAALDDTHFQTSAPQGRIFVDLGQQQAGAVTAVATPRGTVMFDGPGQFEITAGDAATPTIVTAIAGTARLVSGTLALTVPAGQAATVTGTDQLAGNVGAAGPQDDFLHASLADVATLHGNTLPPLVQGMTGCQALATTGTWHAVPQYGQVWYPPVDTGWVPYREGHWAYVAPWGWTWIDNAPWGFAPFHYGRWAYVDDRWGWVPGDSSYATGYEGPEYGGVPEPVYAPALVTWGDVAAGVAVGAFAGALLGGGGRGPGVGWLPLGPGEAYVPPYGGGRSYFNRVNAVNVRDVRNIDPARAYAGRSFGQFANARGATVMAAAAMQRGENVRASGGAFPKAALGASPVVGRYVVGAPAGGAGGHAAQGPALNTANFHPGEGGRVAFGRAGGANPHGAPVPPAGVRGGAAAGAGLPALRSHDAVVAGRPGAAPESEHGGGLGAHPGLVAGAAAGAVGAGLAAHAIGNHMAASRPGATEPSPAREQRPPGAALTAGPPHGPAAPDRAAPDRAAPDRAASSVRPGAERFAAPRSVPRAAQGARAPGGGFPHVVTPNRPAAVPVRTERPQARYAAPPAHVGAPPRAAAPRPAAPRPAPARPAPARPAPARPAPARPAPHPAPAPGRPPHG